MVLHVLNPATDLPRRPDRVLVAGGSGAGKTTVAGKLAGLLALPRIELDELYYEPDWQIRPEFPQDVARAAGQPRWITEWHYPEVATLLARRADLLVWLDYPARTTMTSLVLRTLLRSLHKEVLWSGNQEPPLRSVFTDPENILRYGWATRHATRDQVRALVHDAPDVELDLLRFTRPAGLSRWLLRLAKTSPGPAPSGPHTTATERNTGASRLR
ncbi:adenylate kinase [Streptomyces sp. MST-110588]|uniref:adenylate kinase n=1 Tax=Streptomyces sp. MST-110588 TaxID=2833628 RepID=UPI001F5D1309|nr:adenylate kinase [Streptomyces sp. MST-110588]UNO43218.1 adenylate kinase [Streptomyces sp. MST-110588]